MQVDDEHLSLTDQKDQVWAPLRVHSQLRLNVAGWGRGWAVRLQWTESSLYSPPLLSRNGAFGVHSVGGFCKLQS